MKMLLVNHLLDPVSGGGTAERTYQLARFMARQGVECGLLALDIGLDAQRRDALRFAQLQAVACLHPRYFLPQLSMRRVRALVRQSDIVLLCGHWTILNAMVARACRQVGRPYMFAPAGALVPFGRSQALKRIYDAVAGRALVRNAACCIAVTAAERADFMAYGVDERRVAVIPNGIDPDAYQLGAVDVQAGQPAVELGGAPYLLFLGRLNAIKGPDLLVEAFAMVAGAHSDLHLVLAGPDGGMLAQLRQAVLARGLQDRVHFPGFLGGATKVATLRAASLLVIPSRREAMSIVVLEGGICGCPVLFTDACGLDELAQRQAGSMTAVSAQELGQALQRLLADPEVRHSQSQRLQRIVLQEYTWAAQAQRHIDCARQILADCGRLPQGDAA